jgi:hypothetical protein
MGISDPVLISPEAFTTAMTERWNTLGNTPSPALQSLWGTMTSTFALAITAQDNKWRVLQPPTGTGKTQGLCLYGAMTILKNCTSTMPIGILVVTRTIQQADEIVATVREQVPTDLAHRVEAKHSARKSSIFALHQADVLVITHAAYLLAFEGIHREEYGRWSDYTNWEHGRRRLTIIDESLSGVVEENQVKAEHIRQVLGYIGTDLRRAFAGAVQALELMLEVLGQMEERVAARRTAGEPSYGQKIVWRAIQDGRATFSETFAMGPLREAMAKLPYDNLALRKASSADRNRIAKHVDDTLRDCEAVMRRWAYYYQKGRDATLNSSRLLIPSDLPGPVVLDATATQNFLWTLLETRAEVISTPKDARSYRNVTLHVARVTEGIGKGKMKETGKKRIPRVLNAVERATSPVRKVLLCAHRDIKHIAVNAEPDFTTYSVAHWGAIDGKNDWHDHDTAIILGMPYRDQVWSTNLFFALQGLQDNDWIAEPRWGKYADIHREMQRRQLSVSIIQAINRVHCRRVIDAEGNCPPTDIFIVLRDGDEGDAILDHIREEMPGIVVKKWDFELDGPAERVRRGSSHNALLTLMENRLPGEIAMSQIRSELGLTDEGLKELRKVLRDDSHQLTRALTEMGVSYVSTKRGRGSRSFLLKR